MDPLTIIGTTAAIAQMVSIICRTIKTWRELQKAALNKLSEWTSSDLAREEQHHQLIIDLGESIICCRMLIESMDDHVHRMDFNAREGLELGRRIRFVLEDKATRDFQIFIQRQTSALTLLLTACNW